MTERVFLVIGAGAGIGGHAAARFARGGYHAVLARRSDDAGLVRLVDAIEEDGGKATGTLLDAAADGGVALGEVAAGALPEPFRQRGAGGQGVDPGLGLQHVHLGASLFFCSVLHAICDEMTTEVLV